jgi:hypothetical protein
MTSEEQLSNHATSRGYANFTLSADHQRLDYQLVFWSIQDPTQAHIHTGRRGMDGPQVKDIEIIQDRYARGTWSTADQFQPLTAAIVDSLFAGKLYINVHTLLNPSGEIRGQIMQPETYVALASGAFEAPPVSPAGNGICFVALDPLDTLAFVQGQAGSMSSMITNAHIHQAPVGTPGPVVKPTPMILSALDSLTAFTALNWSATDSTSPLTPALVSQLRGGGLYWNVHTTLHQTGEIRGQLRRGMLSEEDTGLWFMAILSGPQEGIVGRSSNGTGTAFLHLSPDGRTARIGALVSDLDAPVMGAHIHHGFIGEVPDNNVVLPISGTLTAIWTDSDPGRPLTPADIDSLFAGQYYLNIHTSTYPEGEIRGQFIPMSIRSELHMAVPRVKTSTTGVTVYPNPAASHVRVQPGDLRLTSHTLRIVNALGAEVSSRTFDASDINFDTSELANGVYSIILQTESGAVSVPLIVLH